jgi:Tol biopolymer transport system component
MYQPDLAPDGKSIVYKSINNNEAVINVLDIAKQKTTFSIKQGKWALSSPVFSHSGSLLAMAARDNEDCKIFIKSY